jgi:hypothetical protein
MFLGSATILRHVVPTAITSACMTIDALEVEVPYIIFAVGGFSTSREGRYNFTDVARQEEARDTMTNRVSAHD